MNKKLTISFLIFLVFVTACNAPPVEVTRQVTQEVTVVVTEKVSTPVIEEITREVTKEVDRPGKYHIFHFAGHGVRRTEENNLTLDDIDLGQLLMSGKNNKRGRVWTSAKNNI